MLLLDDDGRLMGHDEVENLRKSSEGRKAFDALYTKNRTFAASVAVMSYLCPEGKFKRPERDDIKVVRAIIEMAVTAQEEEQDNFALLFAREDLREC